MPGSPVISTDESVPATRWALASRSSTSGLRVANSVRHSSAVSAKPDVLSARRTSSSSCSFSTGLVRNAKAPDWVAFTASGIVPCAVSMMTLRPGQRRCSSRSSAMPSISAMRRSVMTRSGRKRAMTESALAAFSAGSTSYFCERSRIVSRRSRPGSSSTTRIFGVRLLVRDHGRGSGASLAFRL